MRRSRRKSLFEAERHRDREEDTDSPYQPALPSRRKPRQKSRGRRLREPPGDLPDLPDSLVHLLQPNVSRAILARLKLPVLFFYSELLKRHYELSGGDPALLRLIYDLTIATRSRIAAVAIQRNFRASLQGRKESSAKTIQRAQRSAVARHMLKTMKAVRFLRRLRQRGLLRCLHLWQNETKLIIFSRKNTFS